MATYAKYAALAALVAAMPAVASAQGDANRAAKTKLPAGASTGGGAARTNTSVVAPNGQPLSADPDLRIRFELSRDWPHQGTCC